MDEFNIERLVYNGSDPSDDWIITEVGHSKLNFENVNIVPAQSMVEYIGKCDKHDNCLGHMRETPSGVILPPQSLAIDTAVIRNDVAKAADFAFAGASRFHKNQSHKILSDAMKTKTGRMRHGILNCHIDGSLRMVITPHEFRDIHTIYLPSYLKGKFRVVRLNTQSHKYESKDVNDGDYTVVLRPPTLVKESVQFARLSFWDRTCIGISPWFLKAFRGDYDGDEIHIYPIYSQEAVDEAKAWIATPNTTFDKAVDKYTSSSIPDKLDGPLSFMYHTTASFDQIRNGVDPPFMAEETRTKMEHIKGLRNRFDTSMCDENFIDDSIRGMADTNKQQLSQPIVGDMSRIARIAASCVIQNETGEIGVVADNGFNPVIQRPVDQTAGNSAVRGISTICAASQQSALDSHRARDDKLPAHDLASDLIVGSAYTLIIIGPNADISKIKVLLRAIWVSHVDDMIFCLCKPTSSSRLLPDKIIGSYNPIVLSNIPVSRRLDVCSLAITQLVKFYSLAISDEEITSLSVLYTYRPDAKDKSGNVTPITTRSGIASRGLHWLEVTMANHYSGLVERLKTRDAPLLPVITSSSSLVAGNFRLLV